MPRTRGRPYAVLVGAGRQAQAAYLGQLQASDSVTLAGIVDTREKTARECAGRFEAGAPDVERAWFTDYDVAFRAVRPDIVYVCTPPSSHPEIALAAIRGERDENDRLIPGGWPGAKLTCIEKPVAIDVRGADAIAKATRKYRKKVVCLFRYAYCQPAADALFARRGLGTIHEFLIRWLRSPRKTMPHWDPLTMRALFGGGVIPDLLGHGVERVCSWTGDWSPHWVTARAFTYDAQGKLRKWDPDGAEVEHRAAGVIGFEGFVVSYRLAWFGAAIDVDEIVEFDVTAEEGIAKIEMPTDQTDPTPFVPRLYRGSEVLHLREQPTEGLRFPWRRTPEGLLLPLTEKEMYQAQLDAVIDCFHGAESPVDELKGLVTQRVINGALDSARNDGARIDLV